MGFMSTVGRNISKVGLKVKKKSPVILLVAGTVGIVSSGVLACVATTKLDDTLAETIEKKESIKKYAESGELGDKYTPADAQKDLYIVYTQAGVKLIRLYGPSILLGMASIACIFSSHNILSKRNVGLAAAYATIDKGFKEYRGRVAERFGDAVEKEIRYNTKIETLETVTTDENGKETTTTSEISVIQPNYGSDYARFFDEGSPDWNDNSEYNLMFLKVQQNHANDLLKAKGHLFLNEVYDLLGIPRSRAGQIVGWVYDKDNPVGDNYVDFGIYDTNREKTRDFVNGYEKVILLDFNVDGNIWDLM